MSTRKKPSTNNTTNLQLAAILNLDHYLDENHSVEMRAASDVNQFLISHDFVREYVKDYLDDMPLARGKIINVPFGCNSKHFVARVVVYCRTVQELFERCFFNATPEEQAVLSRQLLTHNGNEYYFTVSFDEC